MTKTMPKINIADATVGAITPANPLDLWSASTVSLELGICKSTWTNGVRSGKYPQPIRISPKRPVWRKSDVLAFVATL